MQTHDENSQYCLDQAREHDLDRYYISLFAPAEHRANIWALIAFYQEVAKTRSVVSEPMLGEIRLQWWREAIDGILANTPRNHPVVLALAAIPCFSSKVAPMLGQIIDGFSSDLSGDIKSDREGAVKLARETGGSLICSMLALSGDADDQMAEAAKGLGTAWTLLTSLKGIEYELRQSPAFQEAEAQEQRDQRVAGLIADLVSDAQHSLTSFSGLTAQQRKQLGFIRGYAGLSRALLKRIERHTSEPLGHLALEVSPITKLLILMRVNIFGK